MKKLTFILLFITLFSCTKDKYPDLKKGIYAEIITNKGTVVTQLSYDKTPVTVANFILLSEGKHPEIAADLKEKKFYNGMTFVQNNEVIQTANVDKNINVGYNFENEQPVDNEGNFLFTHNKAGVLSMANNGRNTNNTPFFITLKELPSYDGKYTIFGHVVKGLELLNTIKSNDKITSVNIIKKGKDANAFNPIKVFTAYYKKYEEKKDKEYAKIKKKTDNALKAKKQMHRFIVNNKRLAKEFPSGLRMLVTKKGKGETPKKGSQVYVNFAGFLDDGSLFGTTTLKTAEMYNLYDEQFDLDNKYHPLLLLYSDEAKLIKGLKEGLQKMQYGEKAMLFIPSKLAYGAKGDGSIVPPNTDLVIEIEILDRKEE
jgi:peptidylprolyl isomerase